MRDYGVVYCKMWTDIKFQGFSSDEKLLFVYLITNEHCPLFGYYRLPIAYIADDLKWEPNHVASTMAALCQHGVAMFSAPYSWVLIPNFLKYNPLRNPSCGDSMLKLFMTYDIKTPFYADFLRILQENPKHIKKEFIDQIDTMLTSCPHDARIINSNNNSNNNSNKIKDNELKLICDLSKNCSITPDEENLKIKKSKTENCPHEKIIELYHDILPMCPGVKTWSGNRSEILRSRWREKSNRQSLHYWRIFFTCVKHSAFLTGKIQGKDGRLFFADLEFLLTASKFARVLEKKYHTEIEWADFQRERARLDAELEINEKSQGENLPEPEQTD
jgi:hypothetical protein